MTTPHQPEPDTHAAEVLAEISGTRLAILARHPNARFFAFWDMDGTLLHGDCSEGLVEDGREVYPGLVQLAIEAGLAAGAGYPPDGGFAKCWQTYRWLEENKGRGTAYPFLAQVFAGAEEEALVRLATGYFNGRLRDHYYASSLAIFEGLASLGVEQHVISASAEFFVRGAAASLGMPAERLHGIRVDSADGRLTREVRQPVTFAEGKTAHLLHIMTVREKETVDRPLCILAGFGNSVMTDGAFLRHISEQALPAGRPVVLMINAGTDESSASLRCRNVRHALTVGHRKRSR